MKFVIHNYLSSALGSGYCLLLQKVTLIFLSVKTLTLLTNFKHLVFSWLPDWNYWAKLSKIY